MKGALRVALLLFTALPVQRWLLVGGGILLVAGSLLPDEARVAGLIGLVVSFLPTLFASGVLLRYIVAPRVMQLIPHLRLQILGAMALVPIIFATTFIIVALGLQLDIDYLLIWLRIAAVASAVLISMFVLFGGAAGAGLWFGLLIFASLVPGMTDTREFIRWLAQSPGLLVAALAVMWCGFAVWLLRAGPLAAPRVSNTFGWGTPSVRTSRHNAVRAFLLGNPSLPAQFVGGLLAVVFITLLFGLIAGINGRADSFDQVFTRASLMATAIGAFAGISGWMVARRSKLLWLRCGLDRLELFRLCEREAWKSFVATAIGALLLLPLVWLRSASNGLEYTLLLMFQLCSGACLLYLGLTWRARLARGRCTQRFGVLYRLGCRSVSTPFLAEHLGMVLALSAAMLVAALALRLVGLYRWRRIDWLVCKPPLPLARSEMNPV